MQETEESIAEFSKFCLKIKLANNSNNDENKCKLIHKVVFSIKILSTFFQPSFLIMYIPVLLYRFMMVHKMLWFLNRYDNDSQKQFEDEERVYLSNFWCSKVLKRRVIVPSCELMEESKLNEAQAGLVKTIQGCGTSLISIINSVLDFAKL
ncbi:unnamed protein product [Rhizophagus irregularis]|uniref:Uncharacterized protein n=1 Tax=Rhizophagus irregularis TaxID=588596 RepID=A0A915YSP3_9GLOM|nr:unnamed protein product [Rhizophagus irregularis]CAB5326578.1 unnamed protein product [Rhizophagus irregularis]